MLLRGARTHLNNLTASALQQTDMCRAHKFHPLTSCLYTLCQMDTQTPFSGQSLKLVSFLPIDMFFDLAGCRYVLRLQFDSSQVAATCLTLSLSGTCVKVWRCSTKLCLEDRGCYWNFVCL
jgi:hypothetical protein